MFPDTVGESDSDCLGARAMEALCDDVKSVCLVKEYRELEESFGTHFTDSVLLRREVSAKEMKEVIYCQDRQKSVDRCREKAPIIAEVASQIG